MKKILVLAFIILLVFLAFVSVPSLALAVRYEALMSQVQKDAQSLQAARVSMGYEALAKAVEADDLTEEVSITNALLDTLAKENAEFRRLTAILADASTTEDMPSPTVHDEKYDEKWHTNLAKQNEWATPEELAKLLKNRVKKGL